MCPRGDGVESNSMNSFNSRDEPTSTRYLSRDRMSPERSPAPMSPRGGGLRRDFMSSFNSRDEPTSTRYLSRDRISPERSPALYPERIHTREFRDIRDESAGTRYPNSGCDYPPRDNGRRLPGKSHLGMDALSRDFQTLLSSGQEADIMIKVKSQVFHAHRLILVTRSTVFAAMFRHDMKEKITCSIDVEDCEPSAFQEFLTFIYTGKIDNLSLENVFDIFFVANKYDLSDLKQICINFMEENLCVAIICNVLYVAHLFSLADLKKSATEFFQKNLGAIMCSKSQVSVIRKNAKLFEEILRYAIGTPFSEDSRSMIKWLLLN